MSAGDSDIQTHDGSQLEIFRIRNGYAVYDFFIRQHDLMNDRKAIPLVVFNTKAQLLQWMVENWKDVPIMEIR